MATYVKIPKDEEKNETVEVIASTIETSLKKEVDALTERQRDEFFNWLCGRRETMPDFVEGLVNNLAYKINTSMGFLCAMSVSRLYKLTQFMNDAEDMLFDPNMLKAMSTKEIMDVYKTASTVIMQTMEFIRRYLAQNQDAINFDTNSGSSAVSQLLSTLPPEKLAQLKALFLSQS
jgi:hypothetical protein